MDIDRFGPDSAGRLMQTPQGYVAFVPRPLPPSRIDISWELMRRLSAADRLVAELRGLTRALPNPQLLIQPFVRREAVLSSRIEGTQASVSDLAMFEAAGSPQQVASDVVEVSNYVAALSYGLGRLKELPLSLRLIREMHARLMSGVRGQHLTPGEFRRTQNWIGAAGCTLNQAAYVPPPVAEMHEALSDLEIYLHTPSDLPPLVRIALVHYQFEAIHPFLDGNGRMGRLLVSLMLQVEGLLPQPLLYLSVSLERRRDDYYRLLTAVSQQGAWEDWIGFILDGMAEQARDATERAIRLIDLRQAFRQRTRSSALQQRLIDELFSHPAISVKQARTALGLTHRGAQLNIDQLVRAGVLHEATGRRRNRVYVAREILDVLEADEAPVRAENASLPG